MRPYSNASIFAEKHNQLCVMIALPSIIRTQIMISPAGGLSQLQRVNNALWGLGILQEICLYFVPF